ncbi:MAG: DUF4142 domain-containing protein [Elusimicrobia bacterium]|nr:DUF4142 domain-containing protein [Elusimicrobiota bacterium]
MNALCAAAWLAAAALATEPRAPTARLTDAESVGVVLAASQAALDAAELAAARAPGKDAREHAQRCKKDHSLLKAEADRLAQEARVAPSESPASAQLRRLAARELRRLKELEGDAFDEAYFQSQRKLHRAADDRIARMEIGAKSNHVTLLLAKARSVFWRYSNNRESFAADYPLIRPASD